MFFSKFPILSYPSNIGDEKKYVLARNIIRRIAFSEQVKNANGAFIEYNIKDGERPEHIADRVYGNSEDHWILLLANNIIDPYHQWYKSSTALQEYMLKKYSNFSIFFTNTSDSYLYNTNFYSDCTLTQGDYVSSVLEYHPTLSKIVVNGLFVSGNATVKIASGTDVSIRIKRVLSSDFAVNRFEHQTSVENSLSPKSVIVDPLTKQTTNYNNYNNLIVTGSKPPETGIRQNTVLSGSVLNFWETYIGRYMGVSGEFVNSYAVTNFAHENLLNESRRKIKVLHPRYVDTVKKEIENLLKV